MAHGSTSDEELAAPVQRTAEANAAFMRGDMGRYFALIAHADDYTLMAPSGGAPVRGFDVSDGRMAELARHFRAGLRLGRHGGPGHDRTAAGRGRRPA